MAEMRKDRYGPDFDALQNVNLLLVETETDGKPDKPRMQKLKR